ACPDTGSRARWCPSLSVGPRRAAHHRGSGRRHRHDGLDVTPALTFFTAVLVAGALAWISIFGGRQLQLLDKPSPIKPHAQPTPYAGGAAILGTLLVLAPFVGADLRLVLGAAICWLVGAVDDVRGLSPITKLAAQVPALVIGSLAVELDPTQRGVAVALGLI